MSPEQAPSRTRAISYRLAAVFALLMFPAVACGLTNSDYALNNQVRQAVYKYERETRGPVDDLVLDAKRTEPRVRFEGQSQNGGRTVWLDRFGAEEFFAVRPAEDTFLYVQRIEYNDSQGTATVAVYRGDGSGYKGRELTLKRAGNNGWTVTEDVELEAESP